MRRGISLMEVLVSIGIVAIGLVSVLSLLPVGGYQAMRANVEERKAALGLNLVQDLKTRGYFKIPSAGEYPNLAATPAPTAAQISAAKQLHPWITAAGNSFVNQVGSDWQVYSVPPIVIDPMAIAANGPAADVFPFNAIPGAPSMKRLSLRDAATFNGTVYTHIPALAGRICMGSDDITASRPDDASLPAVSDYSKDSVGVDLQRQYAGEFTWLAMLTPTELDPDHIGAIQGRDFILSIAILNRRELIPLQEGMVAARLDSEGIGGGEATLQDNTSNAESLLNLAQPGEWIILCRYEPYVEQYTPQPPPTPGIPVTTVVGMRFAWHRIVNATDTEESTATPGLMEKSLTLAGEDWPQTTAWVPATHASVQWPTAIPASKRNWDTYACLIADVVAVYQRKIKLEGQSSF